MQGPRRRTRGNEHQPAGRLGAGAARRGRPGVSGRGTTGGGRCDHRRGVGRRHRRFWCFRRGRSYRSWRRFSRFRRGRRVEPLVGIGFRCRLGGGRDRGRGGCRDHRFHGRRRYRDPSFPPYDASRHGAPVINDGGPAELPVERRPYRSRGALGHHRRVHHRSGEHHPRTVLLRPGAFGIERGHGGRHIFYLVHRSVDDTAHQHGAHHLEDEKDLEADDHHLLANQQ